MHNIGLHQYRSILDMSRGAGRLPAALKYRLMQGWESRAANRFQQVITVSHEDRKSLLGMGVKTPVAVIENGVDCEKLQVLAPAAANHEEIIFIGTMGYLPNRDAARYMATEILPKIRSRRPGCKLNLVGSGGLEHLSDLETPGVVTVTGRVADPLPWYAKSQVAVVPLRSGGGSRLKILEALALGRPVVSTTLGREGLSLRDGEEILTADDADTFADLVAHLLENETTRQRLAGAGRKRAESAYDWNHLAMRLLQVYGKLEARA
jgi:glycosyltransferase involved in cell wall biosynthesis